MGRNKITDGTKKEQIYFLLEQNKINILGRKNLKGIFEKAIENALNKAKKGIHPNQVNLIDSIKEVEKEKK